jgi:putative hydrolase of the HAD superfamily
VIEAALFDLGGVILESPFDGFARYERANGLPPGFLRGLNTTDPDTNAWARLERSEVDFAGFCEAWQAEAAALGHTIDAAAVMAGLVGGPRPAMVEAVRRCAERLKTAILTNNWATGFDETTTSGDIFGLVDVVIESSKVGVRKPDPRFYELACESLGVEPSACVFLDDLGINLKPAKAMGMKTIKVDDPDRAIAELADVVGFPVGGG